MPRSWSEWAEALGQTWPAKMAKGIMGAVTLPGDVYAGRAQIPLGLRREDFTDEPAPRSVVGQGNIAPFSSHPGDAAFDRVTDLAGLVMGGTYGTAPSGALGAGPVRGGKPGARNQPPLGAQPESTSSGFGANPAVGSAAVSSEKLTPSLVENWLQEQGVPFRRENSRFYSESAGPSSSVYFTFETPNGTRKVRLSDHDEPHNFGNRGGPLDFRYTDAPSSVLSAIQTEIGGIPKSFFAEIAQKRIAELERAQASLDMKYRSNRVFAEQFAKEIAELRRIADPFSQTNSAAAGIGPAGGTVLGSGATDKRTAGIMGGILAPNENRGIRAYHVSPYDFDRFDLSKVGTGEGAQAYGHGLYFAENPAVSGGPGSQYWRQFATDMVNRGKRDLFFDKRADPEAIAVDALLRANGDREKALQLFAANPPSPVKEAVDILKSDKHVGPHTYEVNINAHPDQFLDWDKPLSQQSLEIQKAFSGIRHASETPGHLAYYSLAGQKRKAAEASAALKDAGVPGIKYLDQGSRAAGDGSRNYAVFDDKLIDILRKYGIAGLGMVGASNAPGIFGSEIPQAP